MDIHRLFFIVLYKFEIFIILLKIFESILLPRKSPKRDLYEQVGKQNLVIC